MEKKELRLSLHAGSFSFGELEHPNKMPFSGVLTYFDRPSDKPVGGAGGKKVIIPSMYGIPALASLKGMAVNFDNLLMDKHVVTHKVGIIEEAWTGDHQEDGALPVFVSGYIYAHDFPDDAMAIKENQTELGFSYETVDTPVTEAIHSGEIVLMACGEVVFSGAAILLAEKAAFTQTSLAAQSEEKEDDDLSLEEITTAVMTAIEAKYELKAKAEETVAETETEDKNLNAEGEKATGVEQHDSEAKETETSEKTADLNAEGETNDSETVQNNFKAMADDLQAKVAVLEQHLADLKAEADAKFQHQHKGLQFPMTLAAKYNLTAEADSYEAQIAAVDARTDLSVTERMALKIELRDKHLKSQK